MTPAQAARDFGLVAETARNWVKQARQQHSSGATEQAQSSIYQARLAELERRNAELDAVALKLNTRPRKILDYRTPLISSPTLLHRRVEPGATLFAKEQR